MRSVAGTRGVVHEERLLGRVDVRVEHHLDRLISEVLAEVVAVLGPLRRARGPVVERQVGVPVVRLAAQEPVEALEPAAERPAVQRTGWGVLFRGRQVPLAEAERVVALRDEHLGQHAVGRRHPPVVTREPRGQFLNAGDAAGMVVAAGQNARPRRRTQRGRVHVRVAQARVRDAIDVRRVDKPAEAIELPVTDVVEHEEQHVRSTVFGSRRSRPRRARLLDRAPDHSWEFATWRVLDELAHLHSIRSSAIPQLSSARREDASSRRDEERPGVSGRLAHARGRPRGLRHPRSRRSCGSVHPGCALGPGGRCGAPSSSRRRRGWWRSR